MDLGVRFRDTELALGIAFDLRDGEALEDEAFSRGSGMPSDFASLARDPLDDLLAVDPAASLHFAFVRGSALLDAPRLSDFTRTFFRGHDPCKVVAIALEFLLGEPHPQLPIVPRHLSPFLQLWLLCSFFFFRRFERSLQR